MTYGPAQLLSLLLLMATRGSDAQKTLDMLSEQPQISQTDIARRIQECNVTRICTNDEMFVSPLCGSDGRTYNSLCEIKKAACHGNPVVEKYKGVCSDKSKCKLERSFQQSIAKLKNGTTVFIPECELDGSYSSVQCHKATGYCWCVTNGGRPIPGTSVHLKRPSCLPQGKVGRRSSRKRLPGANKGCTSADRITFNSMLVKVFMSEYERLPRNQKQQSANEFGLVESAEKRVIQWKYSALDLNKDNKLSEKELRGLKRLVRRVIRPEPCAKTFTKYCDLNQDRKVTPSEWSICLGVDINRIAFLSIKDGSPVSTPGLAVTTRPAMTVGSSKTPRPNRPYIVDPLLEASRLVQTSRHPYNILNEMSHSQSGAVKHAEDEGTDCRSTRSRALKVHYTTPESGVYIPDCMGPSNSLFNKIQCHRSTGYCWCVDVKNNRPIPGTSLRFADPDCDRSRFHTGPLHDFKNCAGKRKRKFMITFHGTLESAMLASTKLDLDGSVSQTTQAVKWKFQQLDKNKNGRLERREWKEFRKELKSLPGVGRCGRNFLPFCAGSDKKITMDEWLACSDDLDSSQPSTKRRRPGKGPNPFEHILKPAQR